MQEWREMWGDNNNPLQQVIARLSTYKELWLEVSQVWVPTMPSKRKKKIKNTPFYSLTLKSLEGAHGGTKGQYYISAIFPHKVILIAR